MNGKALLLCVLGLSLFLFILRMRRQQRDARIKEALYKPKFYAFDKYTSELPNSDFNGEHPEEDYRKFFQEHFMSQVFLPSSSGWNTREFPDATTSDSNGNSHTTQYAPMSTIPSTATVMRVDDLSDNTINTGVITQESDGSYIGFVFSLGLGALPKQYHSRTYSTTASNITPGSYTGANPYTNISEAMVFNGFDINTEFSSNPASNRHINGMVGSCDIENVTADPRGETTLAGQGNDAAALLHFTYSSKGPNDMKSTYDKNPQGMGLIPGGCRMVDTMFPDTLDGGTTPIHPYNNPNNVVNPANIYPSASKILGPLSSGNVSSYNDQVRTLSALDGTPILNNNAVSGSCPVMNIDHNNITFPDFSDMSSQSFLSLPLKTSSHGILNIVAGSYSGDNYGYRSYNGPARVFHSAGAEMASVEGHRKMLGMGGFVMNTSMVGLVNTSTTKTDSSVNMNSSNSCSIKDINYGSNTSSAGAVYSFTNPRTPYGLNHPLDGNSNTTNYTIPLLRQAMLHPTTGIVAPINYNGQLYVGGCYAIDRLCSIFPELIFTTANRRYQNQSSHFYSPGVLMDKFATMMFQMVHWKFMEMYINGTFAANGYVSGTAFTTILAGIQTQYSQVTYQGNSAWAQLTSVFNWMNNNYNVANSTIFTVPTSQVQIDTMNYYFNSAIGVGPSLDKLMYECFYAAGNLDKLTMLAQTYSSGADPRSTWFYATYPEHRKKSRIYFDGYNSSSQKRWASGAFKVNDPFQIIDRTGLQTLNRLSGSTATYSATSATENLVIYADEGETNDCLAGLSFTDCTPSLMPSLQTYFGGSTNPYVASSSLGSRVGIPCNFTFINRQLAYFGNVKQIIYTKDYQGVGDYHNLIINSNSYFMVNDYFPSRSIVIPKALDRGQLYTQPTSFPRVYGVLKFLGNDKNTLLTYFWAHIPLYPGCGYPTMKCEITDQQGKPDFMNNSFHDNIFMFYLVGAETNSAGNGWQDDLVAKGIRPICAEDYYIESVYHGRAQLVRAIDASTRTLDIGNYSRFNEDGLFASFGPSTREAPDIPGAMMGNFRFYGDQNGMFVYKEKVYGNGDFTVYSEYITVPGMASCSTFKCWTPFRESNGAQSVFQSVVVEAAQEGTTASATVTGTPSYTKGGVTSGSASISSSNTNYLNLTQQRENLNTFRIFKHPCHPQRVVAPVIKNLGVFKAEGWSIINFGSNVAGGNKWISPTTILNDYSLSTTSSTAIPYDSIRRYDAGSASYPIAGSAPATPPGCPAYSNSPCTTQTVVDKQIMDAYHSLVTTQTSKWGLPAQSSYLTRGDWIQVDIGSSLPISSYRIKAVWGLGYGSTRSGPTTEGNPATFGLPQDRTMSDWTLLGSSDNQTWWLIDVQKNQTFPDSNTGNVYPATYTGTYQYYRLVGNAVSQDNFELIWDLAGFYVTCNGTEYPTQNSVPYQTKTTTVQTSPSTPGTRNATNPDYHSYPYVYIGPTGIGMMTSLQPYGFDNNYNYTDPNQRTIQPLIMASTTNIPSFNNASVKDTSGRNMYSFPGGVGMNSVTANYVRAGDTVFMGNPSVLMHGADNPWSYRQPIMSQYTATPALNYADAQLWNETGQPPTANGGGCRGPYYNSGAYGPGNYQGDGNCWVTSGVGNSFFMQNYSNMDYQYSTNQLYGYLINAPSGSVSSTTISLNNYAFFWPEQHAWMMTYGYTNAYNDIANGNFLSVNDDLNGLLKIVNFNYNKNVKGKNWDKPYAMTPDRRKYSYYRGTTTTAYSLPPNATGIVPLASQTIRPPDQDQLDNRFIWPLPYRGGSYLVSACDPCPSNGSCNTITNGLNGGGSKETCTPQYCFWIADQMTYSTLVNSGITVQNEFNTNITFDGDTNVYNNIPKQCLGRLYTNSTTDTNLDITTPMSALYPPPALYKVKQWTLFTYGVSSFISPTDSSKKLNNAIISQNGKVVFLIQDLATAVQYDQYNQTTSGQKITSQSARKVIAGCQKAAALGGTSVTIACQNGTIQQSASLTIPSGTSQPSNDSTYTKWGRWDANCCRDKFSNTNDTKLAINPLPARCINQATCTITESDLAAGYVPHAIPASTSASSCPTSFMASQPGGWINDPYGYPHIGSGFYANPYKTGGYSAANGNSAMPPWFSETSMYFVSNKSDLHTNSSAYASTADATSADGFIKLAKCIKANASDPNYLSGTTAIFPPSCVNGYYLLYFNGIGDMTSTTYPTYYYYYDITQAITLANAGITSAYKSQYEVAWNCDFSGIPQHVSPPATGQTVAGTQFYQIPTGMSGAQLHGDYYKLIRKVHKQENQKVFDLEEMPETKKWIDAQLKQEWMSSEAYHEYVKQKKESKKEHFDILGDIDICKMAGGLLEPLANGILDVSWNPLIKGLNNLKFFRDFGLTPKQVSLSWSCPIPGLGELFAGIAAVAQAIGKFFSDCFTLLCDLFELAITGLINLGKKLYNFLASVFTLENLSNFAHMVADGLTAGFNYINNLLGGALTAIAGAIAQVALAIYNFGAAAVSFLIQVGEVVWNAISTAGVAAFNALCWLGSGIVSLISDGISAVANFLVNIAEIIANIIVQIVVAIKNAICASLNAVLGICVCNC